MTEKDPWHYCKMPQNVKLGFGPGVDEDGVEGMICTYSTKNRNAMRVHLRTLHGVYYCEYCRLRWYGAKSAKAYGQKQMWKTHMRKEHGRK